MPGLVPAVPGSGSGRLFERVLSLSIVMPGLVPGIHAVKPPPNF
jgi:hypothetical protein